MPCSGCGGGAKVSSMGLRTNNSNPDETVQDDSADYVVTYENGTTRTVWGAQAAEDLVAQYGGSYAPKNAPAKRGRKGTSDDA